MANDNYPTSPIATDRMPPGIPYIIGNEAAERFSFYGMKSILVIFMTKYLMDTGGGPATMSDADAMSWYHAFNAGVYFFPVLGAILADSLLGKYRTILCLSLVYCLGHAALACDESRIGLGVGLILIAVAPAASSRACRPTWATSSVLGISTCWNGCSAGSTSRSTWGPRFHPS